MRAAPCFYPALPRATDRFYIVVPHVDDHNPVASFLLFVPWKLGH
jgi:hypothetical protein